MNNWTALDVLKQVAGELGLPVPASIVSDDTQIVQLVSLLNSAGNELNLYYPWEQFVKFHSFATSNGVDTYPVPVDLSYYVDQTQWDRTNRWPLMGPKSPQEWNWLKHGLIASAPRTRYRIYDRNIMLLPIPGATVANLSIEYIKCNWVIKTPGNTEAAMVALDGDTIDYHPWLLVKFLKLKFYELKGFDTTAAKADFMRMFLTLTGKDKGAPVLSLVQTPTSVLIGPWSVPDGSWPAS